MLGTAFSVYDGGVNPGKASDGAVRHELAAVEYAALALDLSQPSLLLPLVLLGVTAAAAGTRRTSSAPRGPAS